MAQAQWDFKSSLSSIAADSDFTTQFRYPLKDCALDAVDRGIDALKQCAPFVVAFNREFSTIQINSLSGITLFKVVERTLLEDNGLEQVIVSQTQEGTVTELRFILAHSGATSVAFPLSNDDDPECLPLGEIPRLFLGFPLIGTEDFCFPAVINSFDFTPTENRDGVYIARNRNNNDANAENQAAITTACELLITLLRFAASSGWGNVHHLADIPTIPDRYWLNEAWLRMNIEKLVIKAIRQTPVVLNHIGRKIPANDVEIPVADTPEAVESLYDLLKVWEGARDKMPARSEVAGWASALKSWAMICNSDVSSFAEVINGSKLAKRVQEVAHDPRASNPTYRVRLLQESLAQTACAISWLDQLHGFLIHNGLADEIRQSRIVPSQFGFLRSLPDLHRDKNIDGELKEIADLMDAFNEWKIRRELRDVHLDIYRRGIW